MIPISYAKEMSSWRFNEIELYQYGLSNWQMVNVTITSSSNIVTGISPQIKFMTTTGKSYNAFHGTSIIFEVCPDKEHTVTHEIGHDLGMLHVCGEVDCFGHDCCVMHYAFIPLMKFDPHGNPIFDWTHCSGGDFCAKHINALRNAHLEDNTETRKLDWK